MNISDNMLETMLQNKRNININGLPATDINKSLKANKVASLSDFISMLSNIVSKSLKEYNVVLDPDEGRILGDNNYSIENPIIIYSIKSSVPKFNRKQYQMETIIENENNPRYGNIYIQDFKSILQFDIVASEYKVADTILSDFMDLFVNYAGYFKINGVQEILFEKRLTDQQLNIYRQHNSVRSVQYSINTQKQTIIFDTTINNIDNLVGEHE